MIKIMSHAIQDNERSTGDLLKLKKMLIEKAVPTCCLVCVSLDISIMLSLTSCWFKLISELKGWIKFCIFL